MARTKQTARLVTGGISRAQIARSNYMRSLQNLTPAEISFFNHHAPPLISHHTSVTPTSTTRTPAHPVSVTRRTNPSRRGGRGGAIIDRRGAGPGPRRGFGPNRGFRGRRGGRGGISYNPARGSNLGHYIVSHNCARRTFYDRDEVILILLLLLLLLLLLG